MSDEPRYRAAIAAKNILCTTCIDKLPVCVNKLDTTILCHMCDLDRQIWTDCEKYEKKIYAPLALTTILYDKKN